MNNPYDLTRLLAGGQLIEKKKYSPEIFTKLEQKQMLATYKQVAKKYWTKLPLGTHIRYIRKDGEMRKGGYIRYNDPHGQFISLSLTQLDQPQTKFWKLPLNGVAELWCEPLNKSTQVHTNTVNDSDTAEQINTLKEDIRQLKLEIQRVMNQQKRIIKSVGINAVRLDKIESGGRH
jgi:hypothetical protein